MQPTNLLYILSDQHNRDLLGIQLDLDAVARHSGWKRIRTLIRKLIGQM